MPRTGRPPKPIEQKISEGTLRPRDKQTPLVVGGRELPKPSSYLTRLEKQRFRAIVKTLESSGILDKADRGMIELAAMEEANIIDCNRMIADKGIVITSVSARGYEKDIPNPAIVLKQRSIQSLRLLYAEIGIGPSSRARLRGLGIVQKEDTKMRDIPGLASANEKIKAFRTA